MNSFKRVFKSKNTNKIDMLELVDSFHLGWNGSNPCKFKSCYLYMENVIWYNLNEKGFIRQGDNKSLVKSPGIYAYRLKSDKNKVYIGSAVNIAQRFRQHRYRSLAYKANNKKFYNFINKYGWNNIEYGIVEKLHFSANNNDIVMNKKLLLDREQYYLDKYSPSLNINKLAGSMMGYKHTEENKLKFSSTRIGKSYKKNARANQKPLVSKETIAKLRSKGAITRIYDKSHNLVKQFKTIKDAANFFGLSPSSVSKYINKNTVWNNTYYFKINEKKICCRLIGKS